MQAAQTVTNFVDDVNNGIYQNWNASSAQQRATGVFNAGRTALQTSGVTILPTLNFANAQGNAVASFNFSFWRVTMGAGLVPANPTRNQMIEVCVSVYHELRHCQQAWAAARYIAKVARSVGFLRANRSELSQADQTTLNQAQVQSATLYQIAARFIAAKCKFPAAVCTAAVNSPMANTDADFQIAKDFYETRFGNSGATLLAQLADHSAVRIRLTNGNYSAQRYAQVYAQYYQNQPHEQDALNTEQLVATEINTRQLF